MNWASHAIDALLRGEEAVIKPHGNSMSGKVESGDKVTLVPLADRVLSVGDIVLVKMHKTVYLHLISAVHGDKYQISNNKKNVNGWVGRYCIYGIATKIESGQ